MAAVSVSLEPSPRVVNAAKYLTSCKTAHQLLLVKILPMYHQSLRILPSLMLRDSSVII